MAQKYTYVVKVYNIFEGLIVNNDQTRIHLVSTRGARIWEQKEQSMLMFME